MNIETNPTIVKDLGALAAQIRAAHQAVGLALGNALDQAMAAGDALIAAHDQVKHGEWAVWLERHCDLHERVARRYVQLAKARPVLEANRTRESVLSLAAALKLIAGEADKRADESPKKKSAKSAVGLSTLAWSQATPEQRRRFLDGVGLVSIFAAMPLEWQAEIERRAAGHRKAKTGKLSDAVTKALRQALSLQKIHRDKDGMAPGVGAALNALNNLLVKAGADLNDISGLTFDESLTRAARNAA